VKQLVEHWNSLTPEAQLIIVVCVFFLFICWYCCAVLLYEIDNAGSDGPDIDSLVDKLVNDERDRER
jgi:hypothetical protein